MKIKNIKLKLVYMYLISLYIFNNVEGTGTNYISLILLIILVGAFLLNFFKEKKIVFNKYFIFYIIFILFGLFSLKYALQPAFVTSKIIQLIVNCIIIFAFTNILDTKDKIISVLKSFVVAGIILSVLSIITSDFSTLSNFSRVGANIGNVNSISMAIMYSTIALMIVNRKEKKNKSYLLYFLFIGTIFLTGSRKGIISIILLLLIHFLVKNRDNFNKTIINIIFSIIAVILLLFFTMNIPFLYNIIGVRIESLFAFLNTGAIKDFSIYERNNMIKFGIEWFKNRPWTGYGLDNFRYLYYNMFNYNFYAHNNYIELLVDLGILGLIIYYIPFWVAIKNTIKCKINDKYIKYILLSLFLIILLMDFARVSYEDRLLVIIISIIFSYLRINKKGEANEKSISNNGNI